MREIAFITGFGNGHGASNFSKLRISIRKSYAGSRDSWLVIVIGIFNRDIVWIEGSITSGISRVVAIDSKLDGIALIVIDNVVIHSFDGHRLVFGPI